MHRRKRMVAASTLLLAASVIGYMTRPAPKEVLYVGTFAGRGSEGIYVFEFDRKAITLTPIQTVRDRPGPNFQVVHPNGSYLYSVSEHAFSDEAEDGSVTAYRIDRGTGRLTKINERATGGRGPAHVSVDPLGRFVYVSNYGGGSLSVFPIAEDGGLENVVDRVEHQRDLVGERGPLRPRVHSAVPSADGRTIYVSDLGLDRIAVYEVNATSGRLTAARPPYVESMHGSGPRHFAIHPDYGYAYSAEELSSTVTAYRVDSSTAALTPIQRVSMLPDAFEGRSHAADIHISPDGRFLYASNRGHDSLVIYEIDEVTGKLSVVGHEPTRGGHPRNFAIDRDGLFVFVVNRDNDNLVVFRRDAVTGMLTHTGLEVRVPMAVCVTQHFVQ